MAASDGETTWPAHQRIGKEHRRDSVGPRQAERSVDIAIGYVKCVVSFILCIVLIRTFTFLYRQSWHGRKQVRLTTVQCMTLSIKH